MTKFETVNKTKQNQGGFLMAVKKTVDDLNEDQRFLVIQKKVMETQIQKIMEWDLDGLFKFSSSRKTMS